MEEKLRNLSQNIENNTGDNAHKPEETPPPEEHHEEEFHEEEHREESHEEHHEESHDEPPMDEAEENVPEEDIDVESSEKARPETVSRNPHEDFAQPLGTQRARSATESEPRDDGRERTGSKDERFGASDAEKEDSSDSSSAKILSMTEENEPQESPTRTKKYSPEVEAALNRLNSEETAVNFNAEPLSTEPKKQHHGGRIFLSFLLILAIAAAALCVLVEQKIIDNPLNLFDKKESTSEITEQPTQQPTTQRTTEPVALTDSALIKTIDALFEKHVATDNYYVFSRTSRALNGKNYIYYDVAETPAVDCGASEDSDAVTDCIVAKVTADNYQNYPAFRYTFVKIDFDVYEFQERASLESSKTVDNVSEQLDNTTEKE